MLLYGLVLLVEVQNMYFSRAKQYPVLNMARLCPIRQWKELLPVHILAQLLWSSCLVTNDEPFNQGIQVIFTVFLDIVIFRLFSGDPHCQQSCRLRVSKG